VGSIGSFSAHPLSTLFWGSIKSVWNVVASVFSPPVLKEQDFSISNRNIVVLPSNGRSPWEPLNRLLDEEGVPSYPMIPFPVLGISIKIPKFFLTDISRIGAQDTFFINDQKMVKPVKTEEERTALIQKLLAAANGDPQLVGQWTQIWNHRLKIFLCNEIKRRIKASEHLNPAHLDPVIGRDGLKKVELVLNTRHNLLHLRIEGVVIHGTNDECEIMNLHIEFEANCTVVGKIIRSHFHFQPLFPTAE